jgi:hypothetical protein
VSTATALRMASIIAEALQSRGWSAGECTQIMERYREGDRHDRHRSSSLVRATGTKPARGEKMSFGKFRGVPLREVSTSYLEWIAEEPGFRREGWQWAREAAEEELQRRRLERERRRTRTSRG